MAAGSRRFGKPWICWPARPSAVSTPRGVCKPATAPCASRPAHAQPHRQYARMSEPLCLPKHMYEPGLMGPQVVAHSLWSAGWAGQGPGRTATMCSTFIFAAPAADASCSRIRSPLRAPRRRGVPMPLVSGGQQARGGAAQSRARAAAPGLVMMRRELEQAPGAEPATTLRRAGGRRPRRAGQDRKICLTTIPFFLKKVEYAMQCN